MRCIGLGTSDPKRLDPAKEFIVMELCNGGNLRSLVSLKAKSKKVVPYNYVDALRWSLQTAEGISYLHSCTPMVR